jgi:hypothetical protein
MNFHTCTTHLIAVVLAICAMDLAVAQTETPPLTIKKLRTGWNDDVFSIETNNSIINPANCPTPDAYAIAIASPGYKTHLAAALVAYSAGKQLTVIVSNWECSQSRPKIMGIYLL